MDTVLDDSIPIEIIFPSKHYMPKELTQQTDFLKKYPEYDGRGTKIAILDTGVDPSCPGLQKTTDGKQKLIDCMDLTGAGDVDTSTIKKVDENGILIGLTERELKIPSTWKNPSGDWHLGTKPLHELYSAKTKERTNKEMKEEFQKQNKSAIAEVMKELNEHEKAVGTKSKKILDKENREEINAKMEYLKEAEKLEIESPVADCIIWFDGQKWKACIDLSFTGDLENAKVMSDYHENYEYGFISDKCLVSYCLNIHENGNLLEICVPNGSHGTHVAHIAAGHFPDCPEKDGLAPGAQIVSLCVGDIRRGTTLTSQALIRALNKCIELKVDIINFSYTAPPSCMDSGKSKDLIKNVVEKHGILFIEAAGNEGPGLSMAGFSGGQTHSSMINVGAYLTAEMKESMFSHHEASDPVVFPFSSRGPCMDGSLGVAFCAPGAAITGVSKHELINSDLKNGTSMASPNAVGNVACLLSGMKAESISISPFRVKLGLMNSAKMPEDGSHHPLSLGAGIIQILSAFELIKSSMASIPSNLTDIKIGIGNDCKRGIYLREPFETNLPYECGVTVEPLFMDSGDINERLNFGCPIILKLSHGSEEGFIKFPKYCQIPSQVFNIQIDPTCLEANKVHFAEIIGINPENSSLGPLFRIPITVIIPDTVSSESSYCYKKELTLEAAVPQRLFLQTPLGCTYAAIKIKSLDNYSNLPIRVQRLHLQQKDKCREHTIKRILFPNSTSFFHFFCPENQTIEFDFVQEWYKQNSTNVKIAIQFFGISIEPRTLMASNSINKINITNYLSKTVIEPILEFKFFCQPLIPSEAIIESMKERDIIDGNPSFRLLLTYKFNVPKSELYKFMHEDIEYYRKHVDCYLLQIFTVSKKHILTTGSIEKLKMFEKGDYIIQVQLRHSDPQFLEKFKDARLIASQSIIPELTCDLYADVEAALKGSSALKNKSRSFKSGEKDPIFMSAVNDLKYPYTYPIGSYLKGELSLHSKETYKSKYYSSFGIIYLLAPPKSYLNDKKGRLEIEADKENDNEKEDLKTAIRDIEISYITKETNAEKALALFEKLSSEFPTHLPIYSAEIQRLSKLKDFKGLKKVVEKLLEIAESCKVAEFFGVKSEFSEENLRKKEIMEKKKTAIINALFLQANLGLDKFLKLMEKDIPDAFRNGFDPKEEPKKDIIKDSKLNDSKETKDEEKSELLEKDGIENVRTVEEETSGKLVTENAITATQEEKIIENIFQNNFVPRNDDTVNAGEKRGKIKAAKLPTCLPPKSNTNNFLFLSSSSSSNESIVVVESLESVLNIHPEKAITKNSSITSEEKADANPKNESSTVTLDEIEKNYRDYMLFVDPISENAKIIKAKYAVAHERYGTALSELKKIITDKTTTSDYLSTEKAIIQLLKKLEWHHLADEAQKAILIKHQKFYRLF